MAALLLLVVQSLKKLSSCVGWLITELDHLGGRCGDCRSCDQRIQFSQPSKYFSEGLAMDFLNFPDIINSVFPTEPPCGRGSLPVRNV